MTATYRTTGINLKAMPLGESDRLVTILTRDHGLIRVVAPGARKHKSGMAGRSGLFVVNDLLIAKGRSLDRITQAEIRQSFVGLGQNLAKLTAAQYLAELALLQAIAHQPQPELYLLLTEHLARLQVAQGTASILAHLNHGIYHLLAAAGIAPQVYHCCISRQVVTPEAHTKIPFSILAGGLVLVATDLPIKHQLQPRELQGLQQLVKGELINEQIHDLGVKVWLTIEKVLRAYAQYHLEKPIESATLIDDCFNL
ncbi:MAG: DNA repair protein RecO [Pseudanabaenaceae cyanobacterium bins.68]|nr:DNA repair protein RecO [Pseudanabaenaceae cyanobacterium bins.68]